MLFEKQGKANFTGGKRYLDWGRLLCQNEPQVNVQAINQELHLIAVLLSLFSGRYNSSVSHSVPSNGIILRETISFYSTRTVGHLDTGVKFKNSWNHAGQEWNHYLMWKLIHLLNGLCHLVSFGQRRLESVTSRAFSILHLSATIYLSNKHRREGRIGAPDTWSACTRACLHPNQTR